MLGHGLDFGVVLGGHSREKERKEMKGMKGMEEDVEKGHKQNPGKMLAL